MAVFAGGSLALLSTIVVLMIALDPYDRGRPAFLGITGFLDKPGIRPQGPRTANASRGRDLQFNAAIFGNSRMQSLRPDLLGEATGWSFVSLFVPGTKPRETLVLIDWFLRHRQGQDTALVIGLDRDWCAPEEELTHDKPFPFWLYEAAWPAYLRGLIRFDALEQSWHRINYLVKNNPPRARADGYWENETDLALQSALADPAKRAALHVRGRASVANATGRFPAFEALSLALEARPGRQRVVLLRPPVFHTLLPLPGTEDADTFEACRSAMAALAAAAPDRVLVDWSLPHPALQEPGFFFDQIHFRGPVARLTEADIAAAMGRLKPVKAP